MFGYFFLLQGKLCFACVGKSLGRCLSSKAFWRPYWKNYISGYIWHRSFILTVNCSFFNQISVNQSFYGVLLTFSYFLLPGKVLCFALGGKWHARCLSVLSVSKTLSKNYISGYIWHKSFFQMVKCSFFHQITVQKSFYDRLSDKKKFKEDNGTRGKSNSPKFAYEQTRIGTTRSRDS